MGKPFIARGLHGERKGRPPDSSYAPGPLSPPPDTYPDPSEIVVDGRSPAIVWNRENRNDFNHLVALAKKFGLTAHELDPVDFARRTWTKRRVFLDTAANYFASFPGISFDEWVRRAYLRGEPTTDVELKAAKNRAKVALSTLFRDGKVVKRYDGDGNLRLYAPGAAPKVE